MAFAFASMIMVCHYRRYLQTKTTDMGGIKIATMAAIIIGVSGMVIVRAMGTDPSIGSPIATRNPCMFRHRCTTNHGNRPASVCFFRSIFEDNRALVSLA